MEFAKYYKSLDDKRYQCIIKIKDDDGEEKECGDVISVGKDSFWNLKRHVSRKHEHIHLAHTEKKSKGLLSRIRLY